MRVNDLNREVFKSLFFMRRYKCMYRLVYLAGIVIFLVFLYICGIIQFESNKVSISLYPAQLESSNLAPDPDYELPGPNLFGADVLDVNDYFRNNKPRFVPKKNQILPENDRLHFVPEQVPPILENDKLRDVPKQITLDLENKNLDAKTEMSNKRSKQIQVLFMTMRHNRGKIVNPLNQTEITELLKQQAIFSEKILALQKIQLDNRQMEINNSNTTEDGDDEYDDFELITKLDKESFIGRGQLVQFLKYEKNKLNEKINGDSVRGINKLLEELHTEDYIEELPPVWNIYHRSINEFRLNNDTDAISKILDVMSTKEVRSCREKERGTQIKVMMELMDGTNVLVKPMKVPRNYETPPDHFYFSDYERHHAEIASFHVDKVLNFYRCPPTVGRVFDITKEIWKNSNSALKKTFFYSPAGNTCFTGHCSYYCDTSHAICGKPLDRMEGSVQLMLPNKPLLKWKATEHPYRRSYSKKKKAVWETNNNYCYEEVFQETAFHGKVLLDLMDLSVFDFIIGNLDRHHFERMESMSNTTFVIHLDHGRAFGRQFTDEMSILTPVMQCCLMRYSTMQRLIHLYANGFSKMLDESMKSDPLYPILTKDHLESVDRRLEIVLEQVANCVKEYTVEHVIVDDGY